MVVVTGWQGLVATAKRATWFERIWFAYAVVMAVVKALDGNWSHAVAYLLVAVAVFSAATWHQAAEDMRPIRDCGELEIVGALTAFVLVVTGAVITFLSCRGWRW